MEPSIEQQIPLIPIVAGFLVLLVVALVFNKKLQSRQMRREGQILDSSGGSASIAERVAGNSAWARGEIHSRGSWLMAGLWLVAAVWNLTFGVSFFKQLSNPEIETGGLVILGLFAIGGGLAVVAFAIRETLRFLRFGESVCRIHGKAGVLGQTMKGTVSTQAEIKPEGDYDFTLQCIETYWVGSGKNRTSKTEIHWQAQQKVERVGRNSRAGIPFSFDLPKFPPETGSQLVRGQVNWQLSIKAPLKGVDYSAAFVVPVFKLE